MNYYTGFRYALGILSGKPLIGPRLAIFRTIGQCNMDCVFCPSRTYYQKIGSSHRLLMDMSTFKRVICDLTQLGTKSIMIGGTGEPFLYHHIWQMITHLRNEGINCYIITNGTLLGKSEVIRLGRLGVSGLLISLQAGTEYSYAEVQGGKNKRMFNKIKKSLELIKGYKAQGKSMPTVRLSEMVYNKNYFKLHEIIEFASKMDVAGVVFKPLIKWKMPGYLNHLEKLKLSESQKTELLRNIPQYHKLAKKLRVKTNLPILAAQIRGIKPSHCYAGFMNTLLMLNGDVIPCYNNHPVIGNVKMTSFKEIWLSKEYKKFRKETCHMQKKFTNSIGCENCAIAFTNSFYYQKWPNPWALLKYISRYHPEPLVPSDVI